MKNRSILFIGPLPPPLTGMAYVNEKMKNVFISRNMKISVINTSADNLNLSVKTRIKRLYKVIKLIFGLFKLRKREKFNILYMSVSGGFGQLYEILFLLINKNIESKYLHHHCYSYIEKKSTITSLLTRLSGKDCVHITQSNKMANNLKKTYSCVNNVIPISNVVFQDIFNDHESFVRTSLKTIGFLSNISKQKGIFEFLNLVDMCANTKLEFLIVGPFQNSKLKTEVLRIISKLKNVEYLGPKFGKSKSEFFQSIDLFVFPTKYRNETEGIVNLEAIRSGAPVIAFGRGCIPEIIGDSAGYCIKPSDDFVSNAFNKINEWLFNKNNFKILSRKAIKQYKYLESSNRSKFERLINQISQ